MVKYILNKVFDVLGEKPFRLWGMSLLAALLTFLASIFGVLPIISIPIALVLQLGMSIIFLAGYRRQNFNSDDLFKGFKDFGRCAGGMAWMSLWVLIWGLIPIAGPVFAVIKMYSYRFTPYILAENQDITATEALRLSMKKTQGFKGKMFGADILVYAGLLACSVVLGLLSLIPYVGIVFRVLMLVISVLFMIVAPLVYGLIQAAFYDEIESGADSTKYSTYAAQKEMEKQLKAQMKAQMQAQMEQLKQQQAAQIQAQLQQTVPPVQSEEKK